MRAPSTRSRRAPSATCSASSIRTASRPATKPWCSWPSRSRFAIRWSTARATGARRTIRSRSPPCATPRRGSRASPKSCSPSSARARSTGCRTSTASSRSPRCCRRACPTCCSTAPPASPSAWRPMCRRTTCARWRAPACVCSRIRRRISPRSASTCADRTFPPRRRSSPRPRSSLRCTRPATARYACARSTSARTAISW